MPGKLQPDILRKSVLDFTGALRNDLLVGGGIGEDAALIRVPDGILVAASDPVTGAGKNAGKLLVHINANDVACKGADPSWLIVTERDSRDLHGNGDCYCRRTHRTH